METSEALLSAWLELTANIRGNRILRDLSLNEIMVLRHLIREGGEEGMTASALGSRLKLLKSQMHKVLSGLEERGYIGRRRSGGDARYVSVLPTGAGVDAYNSEHGKIMRLMDHVVASLGEENAVTLTKLIREAVSAAETAQEV